MVTFAYLQGRQYKRTVNQNLVSIYFLILSRYVTNKVNLHLNESTPYYLLMKRKHTWQ